MKKIAYFFNNHSSTRYYSVSLEKNLRIVKYFNNFLFTICCAQIATFLFIKYLDQYLKDCYLRTYRYHRFNILGEQVQFSHVADGCLKDPHILSGSGSGPVLMHHSFSVQYLTVQDVAMFRLELQPIQISFQTQVNFRAGSAFKIKMVPVRIRIKTSRICHAVLVVQ